MARDREEQIQAKADAKIEKAKASGKAWQEQDMRRAADAATSDDVGGAMKDVMATAMTEALTGQDAERILGSPAFEAATDSILDQPLLVISQDAKFVSLSDEYQYGLPDGTELGMGVQTNQNLARKALRFVSNLDDKLKTVVEVTQNGQRVFEMERTGAFGRNTMVIRDADGAEVGEIKQTSFSDHKGRFDIRSASGEVLSSFEARRIRTSGGFDITTPGGELLAWVRRLHVGAFANIGQRYKSRPDNYVLRMAQRLDDPLRTLVVATPMAVDSAVNQRDDGLDLKDIKRTIRRFTN